MKYTRKHPGLSLEITAPCYNLLFFYLQEKGGVMSEERTESFMRMQDEVFHYFLRHPQYILFRWNANCNGVLVKAEEDQIEEWTEKGVEHIRSVCGPDEEHLDWYVATGSPVERLSMLPGCYQDVNHYLAYRFMVPNLHILSKTTLGDYLNTRDENRIDGVESSYHVSGDYQGFPCGKAAAVKYMILWSLIWTGYRNL